MKGITETSVLALFIAELIFALPVTKRQKEPEKNETQSDNNIETVLEYERYLREVVEALENDPEFRKKLDKAPEADIRNGKIAQELEYVNHHVRSKLDEIKRKEVERLRHLASQKFEYDNEIDRDHLKIHEHIDHTNKHTFEIDDLKKLIIKTSKDIAEADKLRRQDFKTYEMQKEFEKQAILKELDEENKIKYEAELEALKQKHKKHEKVHHPGNKAQLEEVWDKRDHMEGQEFNPKTFFMLHDVDGNGVWDETELKALFINELNKIYESDLPEDDMRERAEEMERMREHVFDETDTNGDGLISFEEFLAQTKRDEFLKDPEWEPVENVPQFTHDEYLEFERKRQEEVQKLISQGLLPPHPNMPQGYYPKPEHHGQNHIPQYSQPPNMHYGAQPQPMPGNQPIGGHPQPNQQINQNQPMQNNAPYQHQPIQKDQPVHYNQQANQNQPLQNNALYQHQPIPGNMPVQNNQQNLPIQNNQPYQQQQMNVPQPIPGSEYKVNIPNSNMHPVDPPNKL